MGGVSGWGEWGCGEGGLRGDVEKVGWVGVL